MQEQLISFTTAKLAKEKGFNIGCQHGWYKHFISGESFVLDDLGNKHEIERPSQTLLQKWLREKKNIIVLVQHGTNPNNYYPEINNVSHLHNPIMWGDTYEEALEVGLIEALKLIELNDNRTDN